MPGESIFGCDVRDEHFNTAIIATIGPASNDVQTLERMFEVGVNVVRLNFSHGDEHGHAEALAAVREAARRRGVPVAVLGDLPGPKIRLVEVEGDGFELLAGQETTLVRACERIVGPHELGCTMSLASLSELISRRIHWSRICGPDLYHAEHRSAAQGQCTCGSKLLD